MQFIKLSFKNVVEDIFKYSADQCLMINDFRFGTELNFNKEKNLNYPLFYLEMPFTQTTNGGKDWNIAFWIYDRALEDYSNKLEILDKITEITDFIMQFMYQSFQGNYMIFKSPSGYPGGREYNSIYDLEAGEDRVIGIRTQLVLDLNNLQTTCELPFKNEILSDTGAFQPVNINTYNYEDTLI